MNFKIILFAVCITYCSAAGGGGHGGGSGVNAEGESDSVVILQAGRKIRLTCNETEGMLWFKDGVLLNSDDHLQALSNGTLIIPKATIDNVGTYKCVKGDNPVNEFQVVTLSYTRLPKSTTAIEGDTLTLTCDVTGNPLPVLYWSKDDAVVVPSDRIELSTKNGTSDKPAPANSTLTIHKVTQEDRGIYTCTFDNSHGEMVFTTSTNVRIKDLYAALWPFLGIVAEVVVLCLVIFIYEKRRSNLDFEEADDTSKTGR